MGRKHKHEVNLLGPYRITAFRSQQTYLLCDVESGKERVSLFFLTAFDPSTIAQIISRKEGKRGNEDAAEISYTTDSIPAKTLESRSKAKRRLKKRVKQANFDSVPTAIPIPLDSKPMAVKSSHSNRKVILVSQPVPENSRARRSTNSGRESKMPALFLVTLDALQEGGGNDVSAQ
jgi:hypothetical protein